MTRFDREENSEFSLSELKINGVKRRIYDVMNVFEGLGLITKIEPRKKNSYIWNGRSGVIENLEIMRRRASLENQNQGFVVHPNDHL